MRVKVKKVERERESERIRDIYMDFDRFVYIGMQLPERPFRIVLVLLDS